MLSKLFGIKIFIIIFIEIYNILLSQIKTVLQENWLVVKELDKENIALKIK